MYLFFISIKTNTSTEIHPNYLDVCSSLNEANSVCVVLLYASGNCQDVWIKNDVIGVKV